MLSESSTFIMIVFPVRIFTQIFIPPLSLRKECKIDSLLALYSANVFKSFNFLLAKTNLY